MSGADRDVADQGNRNTAVAGETAATGLTGSAVRGASASPAGDSAPAAGVPARRARRIGPAAAMGALAGVAAASVAIAASELVAGLVPGVPSMVVAIGSLIIALQPPGAKDVMASLFGTNDKLVLNLAVVIVALIVAAVAGVLAVRKFSTGAAIFVVFGAVALFSAVTVLLAPLLPAFVGAATAVAAGLAALAWLLKGGGLAAVGAGSMGGSGGSGRRAAPPVATMPDWGRRRFMLTSASLIAVSAGAGAVGRLLLDKQHPSDAPATATGLPQPALAVAPLTPDNAISLPGLTPLIVPNDQFYRIDTALLVPSVDASTWSLKVDGMVNHPLVFSYSDLLAMPLFEQYVTIQCVSNEVGGNLVGNTLWTGVKLKEVLANAGIRNGATQIVGRSVDGFTVGFPTSWALDSSREPMIAVGMNGKPLPAAHGYPARLIIPGLYGYVSATKWLAQIELTTWEAFNAYWINLGWSKTGPILTQSRIDVPGDGSRVAAGPIQIAGLAWAPDRGVSRVEVSVDGGDWQQAVMSRAISKATWVQWSLLWQAPPGDHTIEVRATDGAGEVQTADRTRPAPDGARGHDQIRVSVG